MPKRSLSSTRPVNPVKAHPYILGLYAMGASLALGFGMLAATTGQYPTAFALGGCAAILLAAGIYIHRTGNHERGSLVPIIGCIALFLWFETGGGVSRLAVMWFPVIPLSAFYTQGLRRGTILSATFLLGTIAIAALGAFGFLNLPYTQTDFRVIILSFLLITSMIGFYQRGMELSQKSLSQRYTRDELTGLPNRTKLKEDLKETEEAALLLVNVDDFREINDLFGDAAGDLALAEIAKRLNALTRWTANSRLYKLHADEFAFLCPGSRARDFLELLARRIGREADRMIVLADSTVRVTVSVGIAVGTGNLFAEADIALRIAKQSRETYEFYDRGMGMPERYRENVHSLGRIRYALASDSFVPYFQPILSNATETVTKYECLARMKDGDGVALPVDFIAISRRAKLYPAITRQIFAKAFERFRGAPVDFSVNLSLDDILNADTHSFLLDWIDRADLGRNLIFELLETDRMEDSPEVFRFLDAVRERGCRIAIDDFGSGYSNFNFVLRVRPDFLKIDASLVRRVADDANARLVVKTIVDFAKTLGVSTVAEHVHERRVFERVRELGIDFTQGYYVGEPLPDPEFEADAALDRDRCAVTL